MRRAIEFGAGSYLKVGITQFERLPLEAAKEQ